MAKSYEMDMCNGPILGKVLTYSIPLMLSGVLQLLFNAADVIVVGRFAGSQSLAAVGSTSSLINLLINVFIGLSIGANVLVARYYGAKNDRDMRDNPYGDHGQPDERAVSSLFGFVYLTFLAGTDGDAGRCHR